MSLDFPGDKSTLVQVMAWCHQATSQNPSLCWLRFMSPYGVTRQQWDQIQILKGFYRQNELLFKLLILIHICKMTQCFAVKSIRSLQPLSTVLTFYLILLRTRLGVKSIGKTLALGSKSNVGLLTYTWVHMKASNTCTIELTYHVDMQVESFFFLSNRVTIGLLNFTSMA